MNATLNKYLPDDAELTDIELNSLLELFNDLGRSGIAIRSKNNLEIVTFTELTGVSLPWPQAVALALGEKEAFLQFPTDRCAALAKDIISDLWLKSYGIVDDSKPMPSPSSYFIGEDAEPFSEKDIEFFSEVEDNADENKFSFSYHETGAAGGAVVYVRWKAVNLVARNDTTVFIDDKEITFQTESAAIAFHAWVIECVDYYG